MRETVNDPLASVLRRVTGGPPAGEAAHRPDVARGLFAGHLGALIGLAASNVLLGLAALVTPWPGARTWLERGRPLMLAVAAYLLLLTASIVTSHNPAGSLGAGGDLFNFLVPVVALVVVRDVRQGRALVRLLIVLGSLVAVHAVWQYVAATDPLEQRPTGPFSHYMTLGGFLLLIDCLLLAWMVFGRGWRRPWAWAALAIIQFALMSSYTRNAWIALAVVLSVVAALRRPRLLLAWAPALVLLAVLAPSSAVARLTSIGDPYDASNYQRLCMIDAGLAMVRDRPILGHGPEMVRELYPLYHHPSATRTWVPHLHNSYLTVAAERGLPALAVLIAILWLPARRCLHALRRSDGKEPLDLYVGVLLVLLATALTGLFEDYWRDTEIQRLVLVAAALPFCIRPRRQTAGTNP